MTYPPSTAAVRHFTAAARMAARRIEGGPAAAPSLRPSGCRAPGRDRRAQSPGRALPFSSRTKRNSTLCRPGRAAGILPLAKARRRSTAFRDGWTAWRAASLTEPRCASERGVAMGGGRPAERRFTVGGSGKSVARCHRTVLAYWKFESIYLQRRVCELSVPLEMRQPTRTSLPGHPIILTRPPSRASIIHSVLSQGCWAASHPNTVDRRLAGRCGGEA